MARPKKTSTAAGSSSKPKASDAGIVKHRADKGKQSERLLRSSAPKTQPARDNEPTQSIEQPDSDMPDAETSDDYINKTQITSESEPSQPTQSIEQQESEMPDAESSGNSSDSEADSSRQSTNASNSSTPASEHALEDSRHRPRYRYKSEMNDITERFSNTSIGRPAEPLGLISISGGNLKKIVRYGTEPNFVYEIQQHKSLVAIKKKKENSELLAELESKSNVLGGLVMLDRVAYSQQGNRKGKSRKLDVARFWGVACPEGIESLVSNWPPSNMRILVEWKGQERERPSWEKFGDVRDAWHEGALSTDDKKRHKDPRITIGEEIEQKKVKKTQRKCERDRWVDVNQDIGIGEAVLVKKGSRLKGLQWALISTAIDCIKRCEKNETKTDEMSGPDRTRPTTPASRTEQSEDSSVLRPTQRPVLFVNTNLLPPNTNPVPAAEEDEL